jgi:hypothetical protein
MKRAWLIALAMAMFGCRAPAPQFSNPFLPPGPQRVPPPPTGSIGTPIPQPVNPYYPGAAPAGAPLGVGWRAPATTGSLSSSLGTNALGANPLASSPPATTFGATTTPATSPFGATARAITPATPVSTTLPPPTVTNPAQIGSPTTPIGTGTSTAPASSPFNSGMRSAAASPWQPSAGLPVGTTSVGTAPQLLPTAAPAGVPAASANGTVPGSFGLNVNAAPAAAPGWGQPATGFGQPAIGTGQPINNFQSPAPAAAWPNSNLPLNGMPVNDATRTAPASPSLPPWNVGGASNWIRSQPWLQAMWPSSGYSTTAPAAAQLPVRGVQPTTPATTWSYTASVTPGAAPVAAAPIATSTVNVASVPAAPQATPTSFVATTSSTVRGNDSSDVAPAAFTTTNQSSPTPHSAERFANHPQFQWLRGQLEYSSTERRWKLRYIPHDAPEGRMDSYGGSVVLAENPQLAQFSPGEHVTVQGRLGQREGGSTDFAPLYHVEQISRMQ